MRFIMLTHYERRSMIMSIYAKLFFFLQRPTEIPVEKSARKEENQFKLLKGKYENKLMKNWPNKKLWLTQ